MPHDLCDLAQRLVTHGPQGRSPWLPTAPLGIVYHKGSGAHCSYFQLLCQKCMRGTLMMHIKDNPEAWEIFRKFLKPWSRMKTLEFEFPPGVATWPLPSEASISARGTSSSASASPRVARLPLSRQPTPEKGEFPWCTVITSMRMIQDAEGDGEDREMF